MKFARPPKLQWPWIKIHRYVYTSDGYLVITLGRFWKIEITREMAEDLHPDYKTGDGKTRGFIKRIKEFGIIPFWYGYVGRDFIRDVSMYAPIPLNYIWALLRWLKYEILLRIKQPPRAFFKHELKIYRLGQQDGYKMGRYNKETVRTAAEILRAEGLDVRYRE